MNLVVIKRKQGQEVLFPQVRHARTPWHRLRGLIGRPRLKQGEGLLLSPCGSVHTLGMGYPLDVVFLDKEGRILRCVSRLAPFRKARARRARHTLELPPGSIEGFGLKVGEELQWVSARIETIERGET